MGTQNQKKSYLTIQAEQMIRDLKLTPRKLERLLALSEQSAKAYPQVFWEEINYEVLMLLKPRGPENLGRIIDQGMAYDEARLKGRLSMHEVCPYLSVDRFEKPRRFLRRLAAMAIVAEMYDILYSRLEEERVADERERPRPPSSAFKGPKISPYYP